jgi:acetate kinase
MALLTINTGSSSVKAALYNTGTGQGDLGQRELSLLAERIGKEGARLRVHIDNGKTLLDAKCELPDHAAALAAFTGWLREERPELAVMAIGHRIVHGGEHHREPERVTAALLDDLRALVPIDPDHLPQALAAIAAIGREYPDVPQVACFDTAFHRQMPPVARRYALPREYEEEGLLRYGFHGLSYEYIMATLQAEDAAVARGRIVIAHLGNGASMVAVHEGVGRETTMGFSPTGGLVMGTRTGDLDPTVLLYLLTKRGLDPEAVAELINKRGGMLGVSGTSSDMRELLDQAGSDPRAAEAVELFCYTAKKWLGALVATLGGLDTLVFTGGIGERAAPVRAAICDGLDFLGITLDAEHNAAHATTISAADATVAVRILPTDEDLMIARHTTRLVAQEG